VALRTMQGFIVYTLERMMG